MKKTDKKPIELVYNSMKHDLEKPLTWKNFSFKRTFIGDSWGKFFWWALIIFLAFSYAHDTRECRELIENPQELCQQYSNFTIEITNEDFDFQENKIEVNNENWKSNKSICS